MADKPTTPKVLIGLGNPDTKFMDTRHNAGFKVVDAVVASYGGHWQSSQNKQVSTIRINDYPVLVVKPLTYMNNSGDVVPFLKMKGIGPQDILVVHDELEKPPGKSSFKMGGSARGHNGLKSLIERWGPPEFARFRFGIGRPEFKEQVPQYVLQRFDDPEKVEQQIYDAVTLIEQLYMKEEAAQATSS